MDYSVERETHLWLPAGEPKAVIQIIHGMAEHIGRYEQTAKELNRAGYAVAGINLRGHGENAERKGWFADKNGWGRLLEDHRELTLQMRKRFPGKPLVLLGHSMGSFLAREYAIRWKGDMDALVLSGTGHYDKMLCGTGKVLASVSPRKRPAHLVNSIAFTGNNKAFTPARTGFEWLCRDEKEVDAYVASPLCGFVFTGSAFRDFFGGLVKLCDTLRLESIRRDLPVLFISGDQDPVGQMGKGVKITAEEYRKAGISDVKVNLYPGARHELFHETNRDEAIRDLTGWLDRYFA